VQPGYWTNCSNAWTDPLFKRIAVWLVLFFGLITPAFANCDDRAVRIVEVQQGNVVRLRAESDELLDYTVTLDVSLQNMGASRALPVSVEVKGQRTVELVILCIGDPHIAHSYHYQSRWKCGVRGGVPDAKAVYLLPYLPDERHVLIQGYFGRFSHYAGSGNEYAYDWAMPVGTTVCAAREGVVVGVRQDSDAGGAYPVFLSCANYVVIRHGDGTYAEYVHLKKNGVQVALGATVQAGQPIGLSGNTGFTAQPHLHFAVYRPIDGMKRETLPVAIKTKAGVLPRLTQGRIY
jgi:murein DD-endopeptidase MepM/ murein hydrolase activator NlpD